MTQKPEPPTLPVVLELAPLPREQAGPFLILGVAKTATREQIEENWARRVVWARKKQVKTPLEDINWARETLNDADRRLLADATSMNLDSPEGLLQQLEGRSSRPGQARTGARPLDVEKSLADYAPPVELPAMDEIRQSISVPEVPREFPTVRRLLEEFAREQLNPWSLELPSTEQPHE
jgi:hypothetical protein